MCETTPELPDTRCNEFPGYSRCLKKIAGKRCCGINKEGVLINCDSKQRKNGKSDFLRRIFDIADEPVLRMV